jgi:hypothetical protein
MNYKAILLDSLGQLATGSSKKSVGLQYQGKFNNFGYALAIANAANVTDANSPPVTEGFDSAFRLTCQPSKNVKLGLGYLKDVTDSSTSRSFGLFDATYGLGPCHIFMEYVSLTPDGKDSMDAIYFEGSYQVNPKFSAYAGRAVNVSDGGDNGVTLTEYLGKNNPTNYIYGSYSGTGYKFAVLDNWTLLGAKYQLNNKTALQGEFLQQDGDDAKWIFGVRLMVVF